MQRHYLTYALCVLALLLMGCALIHSFAKVLDLPEVRESWSEKKCVEVLDPAAEAEGRKSEWSCDRLPEKYRHVWVY